ncbi:class I SAM-dependent methyltransferase [Burkholderia alba]|uniref:hypothetical protein n=1 Tax=Burkholderia alba TaxID=2683677 RepID=UPI002B052F8D|nr:hypothetical protein [Burkholderia alba]
MNSMCSAATSTVGWGVSDQNNLRKYAGRHMLANLVGSFERWAFNPVKRLRAKRAARWPLEIEAGRQYATRFIAGQGVEVGAGSRPFPLPADAECYYGDVRDRSNLARYFDTEHVIVDGTIDAQAMTGIAGGSLDFVISAHVIEHLFDPVGSILASIKCLRLGGVFVLVVPEMTRTFDQLRPPTTVEHAMRDASDGGSGTMYQAYEEHVRYVHTYLTGEQIPLQDVPQHVDRIMTAKMDIHVHAWRERDFFALLRRLSTSGGFRVVHRRSAGNENLYVLERIA